MKQFLNYEDILKICNQINEKYIPTEDAFFEKVDELFQNEELEGETFIQYSFQELLKVVDAEIKKIEENVQISPTCAKGCANCCYFPIITTRLEEKLMLAAINNFPAERRTKILNHLKAYFIKYSNEIESLCSINFNEVPDFKHQFISKQLPCPMLDTEKNECLAYEIRPIPCRTYLNYSNPAVCKENLIPKEPFSYEFLREYYIEALSEIVQTVLNAENQSFGIQFPEDVFKVDYLQNLIKNEQFMKNAK